MPIHFEYSFLFIHMYVSQYKGTYRACGSWVRFQSLLYQVGLSPFVLHPQEGLFYQSLMYV